MPPPIISNQQDLLYAMFNGDQPYLIHNPFTHKDEWWLRRERGGAIRILASTAAAALKHKHIQPTGALYYRLTAKGAVALSRIK